MAALKNEAFGDKKHLFFFYLALATILKPVTSSCFFLDSFISPFSLPYWNENNLTIVNFVIFFLIGKNCAELYKSGQRTSGVYTIDPDGSGTFDVFCDQTTAGGGWTVFQKRLDGSVNFYRGWADYKNGFGNLNGEFWLGLDKINRLTKTKNRLRVDLEDTTSKTAYAEYDMFAVTSERTKYKLSLGSYNGKVIHCIISYVYTF